MRCPLDEEESKAQIRPLLSDKQAAMYVTRREMLESTLATAGTALFPWSLRADEKAQAENGEDASRRPRLLVTAEKLPGLRSLDELRGSVRDGHGRELWEALRSRAEADIGAEPLGGGNRGYPIVNATAKRIIRAALSFLVTGDERYRDGSRGWRVRLG